jgi:septal ring factor EnvC (AmiA/AmiB activator)
MATYKEYLEQQKQFAEQDDANVARIIKSVEGVTGDIATLNATIKRLQESQGQVTPEDQALIDQIQAQGNALRQKQASLASALEALDESTPPTPPAEPTPTPPTTPA